MSANMKLQFLTNQQLIDCLKKNNFPEDVISVIQEKDFDGKKLLALPEYQIRLMKLSSKELSTKLWKCIEELKTKPLQWNDKKTNKLKKPSFNDKQCLLMNKLVEIHCTTPKTPHSVVQEKPDFIKEKPLPSPKPKPAFTTKQPLTRTRSAPETPEEDEAGYLNPNEINQNVPPANLRMVRSNPTMRTASFSLKNETPNDSLARVHPAKKKIIKQKAPLPPIPTQTKSTNRKKSVSNSSEGEIVNEYEEILEYKVEKTNSISNRKPLARPRAEIPNDLRRRTSDASRDVGSNKRVENFNRPPNKSVVEKTQKEQGMLTSSSPHSFPKRILNRTHYQGRPLPPLPAPRTAPEVPVEEDIADESEVEAEYHNIDPLPASPTVQTDSEQKPDLPRKKGSQLTKDVKRAETPEPPEYLNTDFPLDLVEEKPFKSEVDPDKSNNNSPEVVIEAEFTDADVQLRKPSKTLPKPPSHIDEYTTNKLGILLQKEEENREADLEEDDYVEYENLEYNLNDEPFYRNTDSRGAQMLLQPYDTGAFLMRPSKSRFYLSLSIKHDDTYKHVGIIRQNGRFRLDSKDNSGPDFLCLRDLLNHFQKEPVILSNNLSIVLLPLLPKNVF